MVAGLHVVVVEDVAGMEPFSALDCQRHGLAVADGASREGLAKTWSYWST
jgi:hypothetical protein